MRNNTAYMQNILNHEKELENNWFRYALVF